MHGWCAADRLSRMRSEGDQESQMPGVESAVMGRPAIAAFGAAVEIVARVTVALLATVVRCTTLIGFIIDVVWASICACEGPAREINSAVSRSAAI